MTRSIARRLGRLAYAVYAVCIVVLTVQACNSALSAPSSSPQPGAGTMNGAPLEASGEVVAVSPAVPTVEASERPPTPRPSGGIGDPATFWKPGYGPTPRVVVSKGSGGWASFYDDGPGIYVALPGWTRDSPIRTVVVCANVGLWRCATANVWTSCGCHTNSDHPKIVDLSPDLMALITGWDRATMTNRGVVRVTLQLIGGTP